MYIVNEFLDRDWNPENKTQQTFFLKPCSVDFVSSKLQKVPSRGKKERIPKNVFLPPKIKC
jgi:hypothetical protein